MSHCMIEPYFGPRAKEIQWCNIIVTSHGMICGCEKPWEHLQQILRNQQLRCHFIGEEDSTTTTNQKDGDADDFNLDDGDLAALFDAEVNANNG